MCWQQGARWRSSAVRLRPSPILCRTCRTPDGRSRLRAGREEALPYYAALRGRADYAASAPPWQRALLTFQHANLLTERGADGDEEEAEALYGEIVAEPVRTKPRLLNQSSWESSSLSCHFCGQDTHVHGRICAENEPLVRTPLLPSSSQPKHLRACALPGVAAGACVGALRSADRAVAAAARPPEDEADVHAARPQPHAPRHAAPQTILRMAFVS